MGTFTNIMPSIFGETPIAMIGNPVLTMPGIFIGGCNLRCPYCINRSIIVGNGRTSLDSLAIINGHMAAGEKWIFVSGGEPLSNVNTLNLLNEIRLRGMKVALATNGTYPDMLRKVADEGLADYVVMDVKTSPSDLGRYMNVCGTTDETALTKVLKSMSVMKTGFPGCEFRTTCCSRFVDFEVVKEIAGVIGVDHPYVLQYYTVHQTLLDELADESYVVDYDTLRGWADEIRPLVKWISVREV